MIIDRIELRIGGFENGNAVFISRRIVGEPRAGDAVRVAGGGWRRSPPHYSETEDRPDDQATDHIPFSFEWTAAVLPPPPAIII